MFKTKKQPEKKQVAFNYTTFLLSGANHAEAQEAQFDVHVVRVAVVPGANSALAG